MSEPPTGRLRLTDSLNFMSFGRERRLTRWGDLWLRGRRLCEMSRDRLSRSRLFRPATCRACLGVVFVEVNKVHQRRP